AAENNLAVVEDRSIPQDSAHHSEVYNPNLNPNLNLSSNTKTNNLLSKLSVRLNDSATNNTRENTTIVQNSYSKQAPARSLGSDQALENYDSDKYETYKLYINKDNKNI